MNKTVNINLAGIIFHIDENAFQKLNKYLNTIRSYFSSSEGRDEIISDVESRIAELFQERITDTKQVINLNDVEEIIKVMGQPEEYIVEENDEIPGEQYFRTRKRLYRDSEDKILGGVSGGIGAYLDFDPVWIRIFWVLLTFLSGGFVILIYVILWIVIPEARTTAEKLQMRGEPINVENIEKSVKEEYEGVRDRFDEFGNRVSSTDSGRGSRRRKTGLDRFFDVLGEIFKKLLVIMGKIFGAVLIFLSTVFIAALIASVFGLSGFVTVAPFANFDMSLGQILNALVPHSGQIFWGVIILLALILIPILGMMFLGIRIVFRKSVVNRTAGMVMLGVWLVALFSGMMLGFSIGADFKVRSKIEDQIVLADDATEVNIVMNKYMDRDAEWDEGFYFVEENGDIFMQSEEVHCNIKPSEDGTLYLEMNKYARGGNRREASERASRIAYDYKWDGNKLYLSEYLTANIDDKVRDQSIYIDLYVPVGSKVQIDKSVRSILYDVKNKQNIWDWEMGGHTYLMTENELDCIDCDNKKYRERRLREIERERERILENERREERRLEELEEEHEELLDEEESNLTSQVMLMAPLQLCKSKSMCIQGLISYTDLLL